MNLRKLQFGKAMSAALFVLLLCAVDDEVYHGKKLFRTYIWPRYFGGFSDHLPVYIDLVR